MFSLKSSVITILISIFSVTNLVPVVEAKIETTQTKSNTQIVKNDFNGDGVQDIVFRNDDGRTTIWELIKNSNKQKSRDLPSTDPKEWSIVGVGDFNGDGISDLLYRASDGRNVIWDMNKDNQNFRSRSLPTVPEASWKVAPFSKINVEIKAKYQDLLNSFISQNKGKSVYNPRGGGEELRGQCVSLVTQWQQYIGKQPGYFVGNFPIPAWNALVNGDYGSIAGGNRNVDLINNVNVVQPGDILIINTFPGASNGYSHTAIATSTFKNGVVEIFESNANNKAPNTSATLGTMKASTFVGAVRYR
jgi:hypothetical protein